MREELVSFALREAFVRKIEDVVIQKATIFGIYEYLPDDEMPPPATVDSLEDRDWHTVQNLLAEFQSEVDYFYR